MRVSENFVKELPNETQILFYQGNNETQEQTEAMGVVVLSQADGEDIKETLLAPFEWSSCCTFSIPFLILFTRYWDN